MKGQFTRPPASPDKAISQHFLLSTETQKTVHATKKFLILLLSLEQSVTHSWRVSERKRYIKFYLQLRLKIILEICSQWFK